MKSLVVLVSVILSLNTFAFYCEGIPVLKRSEVFCYKPLPARYAELNEIDFTGDEGPRLPGWDHGVIFQLKESIDRSMEGDFKASIGLLQDIYAQNQFMISIETNRSKRRLLVKARPYIEDAIFDSRASKPDQEKLKKLMFKAIKYFQKYTEKD